MGVNVMWFGGDSLIDVNESEWQLAPTRSIEDATAIRDVLLDELCNEVVSILLYGSFARGEATADSDLDLLIIVEEADTRIAACVSEALSDYEANVSIQLADRTMIYGNLLSREPYIVTALCEGKVLYDEDLIQPLQDAIQRSVIAPSKFTGEFLLRRANTRRDEALRQLSLAQEHLRASFTDAGFAICHIMGEVPRSVNDMREHVRRQDLPSEIIDLIYDVTESKNALTREQLLARSEEFLRHVRDFVEKQREPNE